MQTVADLIAILQEQDPDAPVRIAHQQSWPLRETVGMVGVVEEEFEDGAEEAAYTDALHAARMAGDEEQAQALIKERTNGGIVWIVADGHPHDESPYAPRDCWNIGR